MSNAYNIPALLPSGLFDLLPPHAEAESQLIGTLLSHFRGCGYQHVQPPLMEFEDTLIDSEDSALAKRSFRIMDPLSQEMMAVRADMTLQIARIAGTRLHTSARPLRLCYAGQTLRTKPDAMRASRQFRQVGIELYGSDSLLADIEVMQTAVSALIPLGFDDLSIDLSAPQLIDALLEGCDKKQRRHALGAIEHKDVDALGRLGLNIAAQLAAINHPLAEAKDALSKIKAPTDAKTIIDSILCAADKLNERLEGAVAITIDPLEMRGMGYHTGLSFSLYSASAQAELGRGGRYRTRYDETATGFTLYIEDVLPKLDYTPNDKTLLVPADLSEQQRAAYRKDGYKTLYALGDDLRTEAKKQQCKQWLDENGNIKTT